MTSILRPRSGQGDDQKQDDDEQGDEKKRGKSGGKGEEGQRVKSSHIISEFIDCGVPNDVAYTQWSGNGVTAVYVRPRNVPDDPAVVSALTRAVCSAVSGAPTLPPVGP